MLLKKKRIILSNFWNRVNNKDQCSVCKWYSACNYKAGIWEMCKKANYNSKLYSSKYSYAYVVEKI